jgi:hypothetical protein
VNVDGASQGMVASQVSDPSRFNKSTITNHTKDFPAAYMRESSLDLAGETDQPKLDLLDIIFAQESIRLRPQLALNRSSHNEPKSSLSSQA